MGASRGLPIQILPGIAALLLVAAVASAQQPPPKWPADFAYLGSTVIPSAPGPQQVDGDSSWGKALALKVESDGTVTLFTGSWNPQVVLKWTAPRSQDGNFSGRAVYKGNLGTPKLNHYLFGLYWDLPTQTLYASSQNDYDASGTIDVTLTRATVDPRTEKLVNAGAFTFASRSDKFTQGGVTALPEWFQKASGCGRLAVGYGGYWSVIATGPASMGPALACFDPPEAGVTSGAIKNKPLLGYPFSSSTRDRTPAAERDTDYNQRFGWGWWPATARGTTGSWVPGDSIWQGCAYVDTAAVSGLVCVPMIHNGCVWYGDNKIPPKNPACNDAPGMKASLNSQRASHWIYTYAAQDLIAVAKKKKAQNEIQPVERVAVQFPGIAYPLVGWPSIPRMVTGVYFEPTQALFAVMVRDTSGADKHPTIFWYQVRGARQN